jgi:hypothetical protein
VPAPKTNSDRDDAICAKHRLGMSFEALGREYGLTRQRIAQIIKANEPPRPPGEAERAALAQTLRSQYDRLQQIIDSAPPRSSAIGKVVLYPSGHQRAGEVVTDDSVVIRALAEQGKLVTQYRGLFGCDIHQAPPSLIDARSVTLITEIRTEQDRRNRIAPPPPLAPLPANYHELPAAEQASIQIARRRAQVTAQQAIIGELADD